MMVSRIPDSPFWCEKVSPAREVEFRSGLDKVEGRQVGEVYAGIAKGFVDWIHVRKTKIFDELKYN